MFRPLGHTLCFGGCPHELAVQFGGFPGTGSPRLAMHPSVNMVFSLRIGNTSIPENCRFSTQITPKTWSTSHQRWCFWSEGTHKSFDRWLFERSTNAKWIGEMQKLPTSQDSQPSRDSEPIQIIPKPQNPPGGSSWDRRAKRSGRAGPPDWKIGGVSIPFLTCQHQKRSLWVWLKFDVFTPRYICWCLVGNGGWDDCSLLFYIIPPFLLRTSKYIACLTRKIMIHHICLAFQLLRQRCVQFFCFIFLGANSTSNCTHIPSHSHIPCIISLRTIH